MIAQSLSAAEVFYTSPVAFLPAASDLSFTLDAEATRASALTNHHLLAALDGIGEESRRIGQRLRYEPVPPVLLTEEITRLSSRLSDLYQRLESAMKPLLARLEQPLDATTQQVAAQDFSPVMAEACAIYDTYFQVVRVYPMTLNQFCGQVVHTCLALLSDLPYTLLDRHQITHLINTVEAMFSQLAEECRRQSGEVVGGKVTSDTVTSRPEGPRSVTLSSLHPVPPSPPWGQQVAFYRWRVGHHFFNLCTQFCREALLRSESACQEAQEGIAVCQLGRAELFLRGTTAAMWYAGDFPVTLYQQVIRPSMVMPGAPAGFSGDQNADYNRMKAVKQGLKSYLRTVHGADLATLAAPIYQALLNFHEADIEDNEHHTLIAAHKVGTDQSLAQKEWQDELPAYAPRQTALDILRHMAEMKRREFVKQ